jgi:hypothetical protein
MATAKVKLPDGTWIYMATGPRGETGPAGPEGPPGPEGPVGTTTSYSRTFESSLLWDLPHNLGRQLVDVVTVDNNDDEIIGNVTYMSANEARVAWEIPTTGRATVST